MESVGERIRQVRMEKGITQADLAEVLETTATAVSRYESGKRELRFEQVQAIAGVLGVSVFELYGFPSERQMWIENSQRAVALMRKQIQHNLDENPDELTLKINEGIQLAADEIERQLQAEINTASAMHRIQVQADAANQVTDEGTLEGSQQITPVNKQRNRRLDSLMRMFGEYPDDVQNRILDVVLTFSKLTSAGQKRAVARVKELAEVPRYQAKQESDD